MNVFMPQMLFLGVDISDEHKYTVSYQQQWSNESHVLNTTCEKQQKKVFLRDICLKVLGKKVLKKIFSL